MTTRSFTFDDVNTAALAAYPGLLQSWFPNGRLHGHEFCVGNLKGDKGESLSINIRTGVWSDFAEEHAGSDPVSLYASRHGIKQGEAKTRLAEELGLATNHNETRRQQRTSKQRTNGQAGAANGTSPTTPPPARHPELGEPTFVHEYATPNGSLIFYHLRFDLPDGSKEFRPLSWRDGRWQRKDPEGLLPLYGLPDLAAHPDRPVLLVEGEKTAEVAREILQDFVVVTWPHGGDATGKVDWSPLKGRCVVCWPDADPDGKGTRTMEAASEQMRKVGAKSAAIVRLPEGLPAKWDLGDLLPEGWTEDTVRELIEAAEPVEDHAPIGDPFGKLPAPPLPLGLLPAVIVAYAQREAQAKGVVFHAPAMAALTVCAAAIPDGVRIRVKVHEPWYERACLWVAEIGPPSAKKSPTVRSAMAPLKRLEKQEYARWCQLKADWDKADKDSRGEAPVPRRYILNDTTIEAAGKLLAENPHGMLLERDELAGWFGAMDKYSSGKGAAADRAFWLQSWNGGSYTVDRVSRASNYISNLSVSILGGIQPDAIRRIADDTVDDGLLQRLIPITVGSAGVGEDSPDHGHSFREYDGLIARLAGLQPQVIKFDGDAQEIRRAFERHTHELSNLEVLSPQLAAFCGKLDGLFARLALTFHCCESQPPPEHVSEETARRVDRLMREFIIPHAMRFYLEIAGETGTMASARSIAGYILAKKVDRLTFGILSRDCWPCRKRSRADVIQMLEPLEMFGWLTPDDPIVPRAWTVRPEVHEKFAEQASQERERRESVRTTLQQAISAKEQ